jgi:putative ABC transport system permease protein
VIVDRSDYASVAPADGPRQITIFLAPGADVAATRAELATALGERFAVDVLDNRELRTYVLDVFENTFAITRALQVVASIVAVLAVSSVLSALVSERRAELALLSAIGASRAQIGASVCLQAGSLGAIGAALGALAGLVIGYVLVAVVQPQSFHWTLEFREPWEALATTPGAIVVACIASGLWPAARATRASLHADLREDG